MYPCLIIPRTSYLGQATSRPAVESMQVPFGQGSMKVEFEEGRPVETVSPADTPPDAEAVHRSIANPIDFKDFASFLSDKRKILVVVNDHTRSTPTAEVLKYLELRSKEVTTVIASGSHGLQIKGSLKESLGARSRRTEAESSFTIAKIRLH